MTIVFKETIRSVLDAGDRYGSSDRMKGKVGGNGSFRVVGM